MAHLSFPQRIQCIYYVQDCSEKLMGVYSVVRLEDNPEI